MAQLGALCISNLCATKPLETKPHSRLLVTQEEKMNDDYEVESITQRFYVLENGKFKLIKKIENIKPK